MRFLTSFLFGLAIIISSCSGPGKETNTTPILSNNEDIQLSKNVLKAYLNQNWDAYYDYYADSAQIWRNENWLHDEGMSVDQYIEDLRQGLQQIDDYTFHGETWEQLTTKDGNNWVLFWGVWVGTSSITGKTYEVPVHVTMMVEDGKIAAQGDFFSMTEYLMDMMKLASEQE